MDNHIGRQYTGGNGGLKEDDIPVPRRPQWRHTHDNGAIVCAFSLEHASIKIVMLRRKMAELWRFEDFLFFHIFMNFDKIKINYQLIRSKIYKKNGPQTHPPPFLRNSKIHIIDTSPWLRDSKIIAPTHTTMALYDASFPLNTQVSKLWGCDEKWPSYEDLKIFILFIKSWILTN